MEASTETAHEPAHRIPRSVRGAILNYFADSGPDQNQVLAELRLREGFGDDRDLICHVREVYGDAEAEYLRARAGEEIDRAVREELGEFGLSLSPSTTAQKRDCVARDASPRALLLHLPDPLFASAIEAACLREAYAWGEYDKPPPVARTEAFVNDRLTDVGAPYELEDGQVRWVGEPTLTETAIEPALAAFQDPRLATADEDFNHALRDLRAGTKRSLKDATTNGTKALEGTMVTLLEAHQQSRPDKTQVYRLWEALRKAKIVPEGDMLKELVIAGTRVGNEKGRHADPREVTPIEAEVSVVAIANAIHYLAALLPQ